MIFIILFHSLLTDTVPTTRPTTVSHHMTTATSERIITRPQPVGGTRTPASVALGLSYVLGGVLAGLILIIGFYLLIRLSKHRSTSMQDAEKDQAAKKTVEPVYAEATEPNKFIGQRRTARQASTSSRRHLLPSSISEEPITPTDDSSPSGEVFDHVPDRLKNEQDFNTASRESNRYETLQDPARRNQAIRLETTT